MVEADGRTVYRVTAPAADSLAWPSLGFSLPEGGPGSEFAWMVSDTGELDVLGRCAHCRGTLRFRAWSFARPRRLVLTLGGHRVPVGTVGLTPREFRVPIAFAHQARIAVRVSPGPQSVRETTGGTDPRSLAVAFEEPEFVPAP